MLELNSKQQPMQSTVYMNPAQIKDQDDDALMTENIWLTQDSTSS